MPSNKDRPTSDSNRSSPNPGTATTTRASTRRSGHTTLLEDQQEIKNHTDGRNFLEKHSLLCPPEEPATHNSLSVCLHQISAIQGVPKQAVNAIRAVAFMLDELEEQQINNTLMAALDSQLTEMTSDMKILINDAKANISAHCKAAEDRIANIQPPAPPPPAVQARPANTYASVLVNPPAHANPRVAAREGIKARQFMLEGIKNSKFSHLDSQQLKTELNKIFAELGSPGKLRSASSSRTGGTVIEAESDEMAKWLSNKENQRRFCDNIGSNTEFRTRTFSVIAFNVPIAINPEDADHRLEICEANNLEPSNIISARWAKAVDRRSPNQRTAHLFIVFDNPDTANRAITKGLSICNRRCQIERTKREPTRCLKCQGWNHYAKECIEDKDTCGNCAGPHRTNSCLTEERCCVSCKTKDHPSWSRTCPTFIRKLAEYNSRNPENSLQFFPTADSWSWTATETPLVAQTQPPPQQPRLSTVQQGKRPQHATKRKYDTFIPTYGDTYIPSYSNNRQTLMDYVDTSGWGEVTRSSNVGQASAAASGSTPPATQVDGASRSENRPTNPSALNNA